MRQPLTALWRLVRRLSASLTAFAISHHEHKELKGRHFKRRHPEPLATVLQSLLIIRSEQFGMRCWNMLLAGLGSRRLQPAHSTQSQVASCLSLRMATSISVDEAWESEQGIWYRVGGISHLVSRDRVKAIERAIQNPTAAPQVAKGRLSSNADD